MACYDPGTAIKKICPPCRVMLRHAGRRNRRGWCFPVLRVVRSSEDDWERSSTGALANSFACLRQFLAESRVLGTPEAASAPSRSCKP